jgi:protein TonB
MDSTLTEHQTYRGQPTWRNRLVSFLLAAATTVLIALLMLAMGVLVPSENSQVAPLVAMNFNQPAGAKVKQAHAAAKHSPAPPRNQPPVPQPQVKPPVPVTQLLHMSKEEYAASDISNLPKHAEASGDNASGNSSSTYGPGEGPGGVHLYNAEWYREPTHAELAPYLSQYSAEGGDWAIIACKTIEHYHVENCQELDESPPGSGLARALRQAAWQFLVRPVRVDGHVMIGSWVRIKFTFTKPPSSEPAESTMPGADEGR